jgi:CDP-diacylglycerol--glycerol-3-phosphate 3-phosphatidyltransferase
MHGVAVEINRWSAGKVTPNAVTWFGLGMHVPIALGIAVGELRLAAVMLLVFGLFDTLDGELARLQGRVSDMGGFLDASTDRVKEVLVFSGLAYFLLSTPHPTAAALATWAVGASVCVSYVKAKGEAVIAASKKKLPYPVLNRLFGGGFFPFEVRMAVVLAGLVTGWVAGAVLVVALGSTFTVFQRLAWIGRSIR